MQWVCENGRDAFEFSPEWEGCRFWLTVVMQDVEDAGWLDKGSADQAKEALEVYWRNPEGSEPRVMREGIFRKYHGDAPVSRCQRGKTKTTVGCPC